MSTPISAISTRRVVGPGHPDLAELPGQLPQRLGATTRSWPGIIVAIEPWLSAASRLAVSAAQRRDVRHQRGQQQRLDQQVVGAEGVLGRQRRSSSCRSAVLGQQVRQQPAG